MTPEEKSKALAAKIEASYDADVIVYCGPIYRPSDDFIIDLCGVGKLHPNVLLMLTTTGGDAHAAYRIARCLRRIYTSNGQIILYVNGVCASAGTLITLAADRLILSHHTELGPLDVQIRKPDEVGERTSGLTPIQALEFLQSETQRFFHAQFRNLRFSRDLSFSTRMAADVAAELSTGLLSRLYEQIDPLRLAEYDRANRIAEHYGSRIKTKNVKPHTIQQLLTAYPSHEISIDIEEARELFTAIETPTPELEELGNVLKPFAEKYLDEDEPAIFYLTDRPPKTESTSESPLENEKNNPERSAESSREKSSGDGGSPNGQPAPVSRASS